MKTQYATALPSYFPHPLFPLVMDIHLPLTYLPSLAILGPHMSAKSIKITSDGGLASLMSI